MTNPLFSVITVTYNNLTGLKKTAASLTEQSFSDYEWLVIDGNSHDGTQGFLTGSAANWTSEPDNGIYDAMNKGITRNQGRYTLFLSAGDTLASPQILQTVAKALTKKPEADLIYGDALEDIPGSQPQYKRARSHEKRVRGMFTYQEAMFFKTARLQTMRYNLDYPIAADYDLVCRFVQQSQRFLYIPEAICVFAAGGISQQKTAQGRAEQFTVRKNLKLCNPLTNHLISMGQQVALFTKRTLPSFYWRIKN